MTSILELSNGRCAFRSTHSAVCPWYMPHSMRIFLPLACRTYFEPVTVRVAPKKVSFIIIPVECEDLRNLFGDHQYQYMLRRANNRATGGHGGDEISFQRLVFEHAMRVHAAGQANQRGEFFGFVIQLRCAVEFRRGHEERF